MTLLLLAPILWFAAATSSDWQTSNPELIFESHVWLVWMKAFTKYQSALPYLPYLTLSSGTGSQQIISKDY